jgi:hypothetical protein
MKKTCFLLILFAMTAGAVVAQPSDADIKKQITNAGTKSIKITKTTGTRQWNSDIGNWEWVRGVEVVRKSEYPGIDFVVTGDVVYQYTGVGKYSYWKFRTVSNQYYGIPNPTAKEINDFISKDWAKFYGYYYTVITKLWFQPALATEPAWTWHNPNSVEFRMKLKFDHIIRLKQMYCQHPDYKVERWGNSNTKKTITITGLVNNCNSEFIIDQVNMGYAEGVPQTKLKILSYGIYVRQDPDAINYITSFSDRRKICPKD